METPRLTRLLSPRERAGPAIPEGLARQGMYGWVTNRRSESGYLSVMSHCIRIFSSHRWAYGEHRDGLHALLAPWRKGTDFVDLSVPEAHPLHASATSQVARELVNRIRASHIVLVFAGMYANHSDWMKREIDWAFAREKHIIPVIPHQQQKNIGGSVRLRFMRACALAIGLDQGGDPQRPYDIAPRHVQHRSERAVATHYCGWLLAPRATSCAYIADASTQGPV